MYENGVGTSKNGRKAIDHYALAATSGDIGAMKKLEEVFEKGLLGATINLESAKSFRDKAAKKKSEKSGTDPEVSPQK